MNDKILLAALLGLAVGLDEDDEEEEEKEDK